MTFVSESWGHRGRSPKEQGELIEKKAASEKTKERRDARRKQSEIAKNHGFNDVPIKRFCGECRTEQEDVVTFVEMDRFSGGVSVRRDICMACQPKAFEKYENNRTILRNLGLVDSVQLPAFGSRVVSQGVEKRKVIF